MRQQMEERLAQLKSELQNGERMMSELSSKQLTLQQTLLRISGAIQVLEELLAQSASIPPGSGSSSCAPAE
ncbi:hypothetical protein [Archangium violaceum]|uniref:Uncharacterized protein n=1 Tax=Archangium violaceum Cb vi76 TaxID=1406225 RepID=A0A084T285_9BACT|nr:hypothetical protein [Archangium violaceum]KFA94820.1 hypothetical protein Q664_00160 [Archangium violaceum Cb vi76]